MAKRPVYLNWEGKAEACDALRLPIPALELEETCASEPSERESALQSSYRILRGDALDTARALEREGLGEQVDLVYLDPPYGSGLDYRHEERLEGTATGRVARAIAYGDRWNDGAASYLDMLLPRLSAMRALLKPSGSMWIQADWRASYLIRALCDEIFGSDHFLNEIVWRRAPNLGRQARSGQFGRTLDTLIVYGKSAKTRLSPPERLVPIPLRSAKLDSSSDRYFTLAPRGDYTDASVARLAAENRVYRSASGNVSIKYWLERDDAGKLCKRQPVDALWVDVPPLRHASWEERTGYPTQKPVRLLERVIASGSQPGGLVVDLFAGSGTTGAAAARLGRRCVLGDKSPVAIATMRSRLLRQQVQPLSLEQCGADFEVEEARIEVHPRGDQMDVSLECRAGTQPIAWAVSLEAPSRGRPFRVDWHAERGTGRRPADLPLRTVLPRSRCIRARVYFVDGKVAVVEGSIATEGRREPTSMAEAPT